MSYVQGKTKSRAKAIIACIIAGICSLTLAVMVVGVTVASVASGVPILEPCVICTST